MGTDRLRSELDDTDRSMLRLLQADGTLSTAKLAEQLSLSVTPCWRRLHRLEQAGYINGYQANLDRRKLGYGVLAFVQLGFGAHTSDAPNRFEAAILTYPEVLSCHKITGAADYQLQVLAEDLESYGLFVEQVLRVMPGVVSIHSSLALREIKSSSHIPVK